MQEQLACGLLGEALQGVPLDLYHDKMSHSKSILLGCLKASWKLKVHKCNHTISCSGLLPQWSIRHTCLIWTELSKLAGCGCQISRSITAACSSCRSVALHVKLPAINACLLQYWPHFSSMAVHLPGLGRVQESGPDGHAVDSPS